MEKVKSVKLNSASVKYDNSVDAEKVYNIEGNVNISNGTANSIDGGIVSKGEGYVANFNWWGDNNMNISYQGVEVEERNAINEAVDAFVNNVKESVSVNVINV